MPPLEVPQPAWVFCAVRAVKKTLPLPLLLWCPAVEPAVCGTWVLHWQLQPPGAVGSWMLDDAPACVVNAWATSTTCYLPV